MIATFNSENQMSLPIKRNMELATESTAPRELMDLASLELKRRRLLRELAEVEGRHRQLWREIERKGIEVLWHNGS